MRLGRGKNDRSWNNRIVYCDCLALISIVTRHHDTCIKRFSHMILSLEHARAIAYMKQTKKTTRGSLGEKKK